MQVRVEQIKVATAIEYGIPLDMLESADRSRQFAFPRMVAMALSRELTDRSLPDIGRRFGGRDHTTVIHAVRRVNADSELRDRANSIATAITNTVPACWKRAFTEEMLAAQSLGTYFVALSDEAIACRVIGQALPVIRRVRLHSNRNKEICVMYRDEKKSLGEVGTHFNITRERVRQILVSQGIFERHLSADRKVVLERKAQREAARQARREARKQRHDLAVALYADRSIPVKEICKRAGVRTDEVIGLAAQRGIPARNRNPGLPRHRLKPHYQTIAARYGSGDDIETIAHDFQCVPMVVRHIANRLGVGRKRVPKPHRERVKVARATRPPLPKLCEQFTGWDECEAKLREHWLTHSASEIAAALGCTRNAVIGKAHRLGLPKKAVGYRP